MRRPIWTYDAKRNSYSAAFPHDGSEIVVTCDGKTQFYTYGEDAPLTACECLPLIESGTYHYRLKDEKFRLDTKSSFVGTVRGSEGGLQPKTAVGYGCLWLEGKSGCAEALEVEVASKVINYKDHYQQFLQEVTDRVAALQMYSRGATHSRLNPHFHSECYKSNEALIREMFFIIGLVGSLKFRSAIRRIMANPHTVLRNVEEERDIRTAMRFGRAAIGQIASASRRIAFDDPDLPSLPEKLKALRREETRDTKENRFVKHVLIFFRGKLECCRKLLEEGVGKDKASGMAVFVDVDAAIASLRALSNHAFFRDIGRLTSMPTGSVVLQRREGYREVLRKWVQFHAATSFECKDLDDIFRANQRNMATLYEYWCFFRLLDIVKERFNIPDAQIIKEISEKAIGSATDGVSFTLRRGKKMVFPGNFELSENGGSVRYRKLAIAFFYNRVFSPATSIGKGKRKTGWTFQMKPDYTLAFYPLEMTEAQAAAEDLVTYVHFDAKYKVNELKDAIEDIEKVRKSAEGEELDEGESIGDEKTERDVKHVDILKMHAYRDAVYRTGGAYVLYPGDGKNSYNWRMYAEFEDEMLPAVGAFPLSPTADSKDEISQFFARIAGFLCDRITKWENYRHQAHLIYEKKPVPENSSDLLAADFGKGTYLAMKTHGLFPYPVKMLHTDASKVRWIQVRDDAGVPKVFKVPPTGLHGPSNYLTFQTDHPSFKKVSLPVDKRNDVICVWAVEEV